MSEGIDRRRKRAFRELAALKKTLEEETASAVKKQTEPRPRSLSSAATNESADSLEWKELIQRDPDGSVNGNLFWRAADGAVYVKVEKSSTPLRIEHGGRNKFKNPDTGQEEWLFWDKGEDAFTEDDPISDAVREQKLQSARYVPQQSERPIRVQESQNVSEKPEEKKGSYKPPANPDARPLSLGNSDQSESNWVEPTLLRDSRLEDYFERTGKSYEEFLEGVKTKGKERAAREQKPEQPKRPIDELNTARDEYAQDHQRRSPGGNGPRGPEDGGGDGGDGGGPEGNDPDSKDPGGNGTDNEGLGGKGPEDSSGGGSGGNGSEGGSKSEKDPSKEPRTEPEEDKVPLNEVFRTNDGRFVGVEATSLKEILADKVAQKELRVLLDRIAPEYVDKIVSKFDAQEVLTPLEEKVLDYARLEHARLKLKVEYVRTKMVAEDLEVVGRFDERFHATMGFLGALRTMEVFKDELGLAAMQNPELVERLQDTYERLDKVRAAAEYKAWESEVHELQKETGVSAKDFGVVFGSSDASHRERIEKELVEKKRAEKKGAAKFFDLMFDTSAREARNIIARAQEAHRRSGEGAQSGPAREYGTEMRSLAGLLKWATSEDSEVTLAIQQEAYRNEEVTMRADSGPQSFEALEKERGPSAKEINAFVDAKKKAHRYEGKDWAHTPKNVRLHAAAEWRREFRDKQSLRKYRRGFFARALQLLKEFTFVNKLDAIMKEPVLA